MNRYRLHWVALSKCYYWWVSFRPSVSSIYFTFVLDLMVPFLVTSLQFTKEEERERGKEGRKERGKEGAKDERKWFLTISQCSLPTECHPVYGRPVTNLARTFKFICLLEYCVTHFRVMWWELVLYFFYRGGTFETLIESLIFSHANNCFSLNEFTAVLIKVGY